MVRIGAHFETCRASFRGSVFDKREQEVKVNGTNVRQEIANTIANTLQNSTCQKISRRQIAHSSQVKCTTIDSINREKVQHIVCSGERSGLERLRTFC